MLHVESFPVHPLPPFAFGPIGKCLEWSDEPVHQEGSRGDQYVGRAVSGRNRLGREFAESSLYWDYSEFSLPEKARMEAEVERFIEDRLQEVGHKESIKMVYKSFMRTWSAHIWTRQFTWTNAFLVVVVRDCALC